MIRSLIPLGLVFVLFAARAANAENWPHWRGVGGNGVAADADPPVRFSESQNVRWKVEIPGSGSGSPVVWDDRVFVTSAEPTGRGGVLRFVVHCIDRATGETIWKRTAVEAAPHEGTHSTNNFAPASPCTDGEFVFAFFGSRGMHAFTIDGEPVWSKDFGDMRMRNGFGEGASPTIAGDKLLVPWDHEGPSQLYALEKRTGDELWRVSRDEPSNWGTPLVIDSDRGQQVVLTGQNKVRAYALEDGTPLWECGGQTQRPCASPVAADGLVFVMSGFRGAFAGAFRPDGRGDIAGGDQVVWTRDRDTPDIGSPLLSGDRLYFFKAKRGILTCVDAATGVPHYETQRVPGLGTIYASPIAAGGHVYLTDRDGTIVVIKDADQFEVVASNEMGETVDATPAPVDDELFIRGERHLFCIAEN